MRDDVHHQLLLYWTKTANRDVCLKPQFFPLDFTWNIQCLSFRVELKEGEAIDKFRKKSFTVTLKLIAQQTIQNFHRILCGSKGTNIAAFHDKPEYSNYDAHKSHSKSPWGIQHTSSALNPRLLC